MIFRIRSLDADFRLSLRRIQKLLLHIQGASNRNDSGAWNRSLQLLKSLQAMHFSAHMHY